MTSWAAIGRRRWPGALPTRRDASKGALNGSPGKTWGRVDAASLRLSQFVLADAPLAAVRPHLQRREPPPPLVDEIVCLTYRSLTEGFEDPSRRPRSAQAPVPWYCV
jgi:hypothetical protein